MRQTRQTTNEEDCLVQVTQDFVTKETAPKEGGYDEISLSVSQSTEDKEFAEPATPIDTPHKIFKTERVVSSTASVNLMQVQPEESSIIQSQGGDNKVGENVRQSLN